MDAFESWQRWQRVLKILWKAKKKNKWIIKKNQLRLLTQGINDKTLINTLVIQTPFFLDKSIKLGKVERKEKGQSAAM